MTRAITNGTLPSQVIAASSDIQSVDDITMRVELLVDGVTNTQGLTRDVVAQQELTYPASEVNGVTSPAFEQLRKIYNGLGPNDRVELLVYNDENRLRHAFVDTAVGIDRRVVRVASKYDDSYERMGNQLDAFANQMNVPALSPIERSISEIVYDDAIVRNIISV